MTAVGGLDEVAGAPQGPRVSDDKRAAEVLVQVRATGPSGALDGVRAIRSTVRPGPPVKVYVTGPGGFQADANAVFQYIDGLLLAVALGVVFVLLVLVYRSPLLPVVVLLTAGLAVTVAGSVVYLLARAGVVTLNGQSQGILMVLVVGACTDYALLLVSRYRDELHHTAHPVDAMRAAYRGVVAPIIASGTTVGLALLCLLLSQLKATHGLGPIGAIGIGASMLSALTFLPAALVLLSRAAFWPVRPKFDSEVRKGGRWDRVAHWVARRARVVWPVVLVLLAIASGFLAQFHASGVRSEDAFLNHSDAVAGQQAVARHFPAGSDEPAMLITRGDRVDAVVSAAQSVPGVVSVTPVGPAGSPTEVDGRVMLSATLSDPPDSRAAIDTVHRLRDAVHVVSGAEAKVGGPTAVSADTRSTSERDRTIVIPVALGVILLVLFVLLRAVVAPLLMIATVVLSFAATLGVAALVFDHLLHFAGANPEVPLYAFVFLVALGVDYNIFLMSRIREEAARHGTREGIVRGLAATGAVITSAGVVLAATFGALALIPLLTLAEMAFLVGFGVLLDTFVVRSLFLPALSIHIGRPIWWPGSDRAGHPPKHLRDEPEDSYDSNDSNGAPELIGAHRAEESARPALHRAVGTW